MKTPEYLVRRTESSPSLDVAPQARAWRNAEVLSIEAFHPDGSDHRPTTQARLLYDAETLYGLFQVHDCYLRCIHTEFQSPVYQDACVEFFVRPRPDRGYFNFEMNCLGALLCRYIEDPARLPDKTFKKQTPLNQETADRIRIQSTIARPVPEEITTPLTWRLAFSIPLALLETHTGPLGDPQGQRWRGNFHKCAENNSHPHWGAWASIGERLDFHQPDRFGTLRFE